MSPKCDVHRPRRLLAAPVLAAGLLAAPLVGAPAAHAATPDYTVTALRIKVTVPDCAPGATIAADLYLPKNATSTHRVPAILTTNGFGGSKADQAGIGKDFANNGYAVLSYSGLGFGGSSCRITLDDRVHDGAAAAQLVDYLAGAKDLGYVDTAPAGSVGPAQFDPTAPLNLDAIQLDGPGDPRVGMVGGSYGGQIQYAATSASNGRIDAIVPVITWNNLGYSLAPNNTSLNPGVTYSTPGVHKKQWTSLFFGVGIQQGVMYAAEDPTARTVDGKATSAVPCPNFAPAACLAKAHLDTTGYPDPAALTLTRAASVVSYLPDIHIPTLLMQGQADTLFNLQESVATYRALKAQGTPVGLVWQSWGHSESTPKPGEFSYAAPLGTYQGDLVKGFFDKYLRNTTGVTTSQVGFRYFRDWKYPSTSQNRAGVDLAYASTTAYPVGQTVPLYLSGGSDSRTPGSLTTGKSQARTGTSSFAAPPAGASYSETSAVQNQIPAPVSDPQDAPGTFATWTTPALKAPADVVGVPTLDVQINSPTAQPVDPATELVVFAKVYDLDQAGKASLVHGLVAPVRLSTVGKRVHIELPGIVHEFAAGHRMQLVIAGSDNAYGAETNGGNDVAQVVQVLTTAGNPGVLTLPSTSGLSFPAAASSTSGTPGGSGGPSGTTSAGTTSARSTPSGGSSSAAGTTMPGTSTSGATSTNGDALPVTTAASSTRSSGSLPFTGFEATGAVALGAGSVLAGAALRRASRRRAPR